MNEPDSMLLTNKTVINLANAILTDIEHFSVCPSVVLSAPSLLSIDEQIEKGVKQKVPDVFPGCFLPALLKAHADMTLCLGVQLKYLSILDTRIFNE